MAIALSGGWAYGQSSHRDLVEELAQLDRAICLQQWDQAINITSRLIASASVSSSYRQELLSFRHQLQAWRISETTPIVQVNCDRTLPMYLTLTAPEPAQPQPLDWNSALATFRNSRPIVQFDSDFDPTDTLIPPELTVNSPDALVDFAIPVDTTDGFSVVGGSINSRPQVYNLLARLGDRISLEIDVTRAYMGGDPHLLLFDHRGRLLVQSEIDALQASIQDFMIPSTDVYFAVVSPQGTSPILDADGLIVGWQTSQNNSFDYTVTLTGVTPYQALLP
ncbi:hypothetical protein [Adonisia turfae]|uniref:Uncharacterized protein n=1 Tax=Adonisia turfae CCMR0081 TaxID=2292702 RepID=A0A6M0RNN9_9CYAN|nr:hypothetical protein [Adonisia turfae]NEZ57271.1 hypothetical protein [Adonisia turfae CCMR0081]